MQAMMLALTDQEDGVGMNESPDRLGQAVLQRLPCSSFKQQQTPQYILRSRSFAFFFRCFSYTFYNCRPRAEKAISGMSPTSCK